MLGGGHYTKSYGSKYPPAYIVAYPQAKVGVAKLQEVFVALLRVRPLSVRAINRRFLLASPYCITVVVVRTLTFGVAVQSLFLFCLLVWAGMMLSCTLLSSQQPSLAC